MILFRLIIPTFITSFIILLSRDLLPASSFVTTSIPYKTNLFRHSKSKLLDANTNNNSSQSPFLESITAKLFPPTTTTTTATTTTSSNKSENTKKRKNGIGIRIAQSLIQSLVQDDQCYSTEAGARKFADSCATNVVYEDCFEPQPVVGRTAVLQHMLQKVQSRKKQGYLRLDKVSDGNKSAGFAWTWVLNNNKEEGLRGTTFIELNSQNEIQYIREIPEPLYKPGEAILPLLRAVTKDAPPREPKPFVIRVPQSASDVIQYLFNEIQAQDLDAAMDVFDENIMYRDFNYDEMLKGSDEVRDFILDFSFPGIDFIPQRIDDGVYRSCFTWECRLMDAPDTIKGVGFYEIDPDTKKVIYVRDVPESAIKPPILGKIARQLRPGLGVFQGVPVGSEDRKGGL